MSGALQAVAIGIAFGFVLERAGLGDARKLANQFYAADFTVLKVLFSAIVTAMLGLFWLGRWGVLDVSRVFVPETHVAPQLLGGLLFGAGFAVAGLCPGTSCVAAASGRGDGVAVMGGMLAGVLVTGLAFNALRPFYDGTAYGALTLPRLLDVRGGVVMLAIVMLAMLAFAVAEKVETRA